MPNWTKKLRGNKRAEWLISGLVVLLFIVLSMLGRTWPFESQPSGVEDIPSPSVWQYLLSDRVTIGFARLAIAFGSLFLVASVIALAVAGRWMSGFGGLSIDEKESAEEHISALEEQLTATQTRLGEETAKRQEAEDWADELIDQLDEVQIELELTKEELASRGEDEDREDPGGDPHPA